MSFRKILCPTDFSEASYCGLQLAADIALQNNAELCVLHIEPALDAVAPRDGMDTVVKSEAARCANAISNLCDVIEKRIPAAVQSCPLLKGGNAADEIVRAAREAQADLIVLGTYGISGAQSHALGSVAKAVLLSSHCPVLTTGGRTEL